jgi:hypothetical protein
LLPGDECLVPAELFARAAKACETASVRPAARAVEWGWRGGTRPNVIAARA